MEILKRFTICFLILLFFFNVAGLVPLYQFSIAKIERINEERIRGSLNNNLQFIKINLNEKTITFKLEVPIEKDEQAFKLIAEKQNQPSLNKTTFLTDENIQLLNNLIDLNLNINCTKKPIDTNNKYANSTIKKLYTADITHLLFNSLCSNNTEKYNVCYLFSIPKYTSKIDLPPPEHNFL